MARALQRELERRQPACFAIAHRGARAERPENTLAAFERAVELGCVMVEMDLQSSRDGQVVVHHDDDLLRCTDAARRFPGRAPWRVDGFDRDELASLQVADLAEVLAFARRSGLWLNLELKSTHARDPHLADRTLAQVAAAGLVDRVLLSSFDIAQLERARAVSGEVAIGLLIERSRPDVMTLLQRLDADALNPNVADPHCIDDLRIARAAGRMTFPWTCNDPAAMRRLVDAGATGLITDHPERFPASTIGP